MKLKNIDLWSIFVKKGHFRMTTFFTSQLCTPTSPTVYITMSLYNINASGNGHNFQIQEFFSTTYYTVFARESLKFDGKSKLQVPDTGTRVLGNTRPFWRSSIVCFWMPPTCSKEHKYHIF